MMTSTKLNEKEFEEFMADSMRILEEAADYLSRNGERYELDHWVTIAEYCKRFNIKNTQTVSNWIKRGIISPDNTIVIEEYNNIRLVKAIPYQDPNA